MLTACLKPERERCIKLGHLVLGQPRGGPPHQDHQFFLKLYTSTTTSSIWIILKLQYKTLSAIFMLVFLNPSERPVAPGACRDRLYSTASLVARPTRQLTQISSDYLQNKRSFLLTGFLMRIYALNRLLTHVYEKWRSGSSP